MWVYRSLDDGSAAERNDYDDALYYALRALQKYIPVKENADETPSNIRTPSSPSIKRVFSAYRRIQRLVGLSYIMNVEAEGVLDSLI